MFKVATVGTRTELAEGQEKRPMGLNSNLSIIQPCGVSTEWHS